MSLGSHSTLQKQANLLSFFRLATAVPGTRLLKRLV
jgi:hypothetical protein